MLRALQLKAQSAYEREVISDHKHDHEHHRMHVH